MSAPDTALPSSISSSGHADGLGRRVLAFDRESGAMLERLQLRPELAAFEVAIRERVARLSAFEDERFARPFSVERDRASGELTVVSEFVPGSLLSDLLETSHEEGVVPGVDVALGYLLDALPAISTLHGVASVTHGLIGPARTVLTPAGQVVFLVPALGEVVERLGLSPRRLWTEFGIAVPPSPGPARFDAAADIVQIALSALMLVLGRPLRADEYPDGVPSLLMEVVEVAQIRGSTAFAAGIQRILQRSLPLPGRRPYVRVDEMVVDVRQLVRKEMGVDVCHKALIDFVEQMDAASIEVTLGPREYASSEGGDAFGALDYSGNGDGESTGGDDDIETDPADVSSDIIEISLDADAEPVYELSESVETDQYVSDPIEQTESALDVAAASDPIAASVEDHEIPDTAATEYASGDHESVALESIASDPEMTDGEAPAHGEVTGDNTPLVTEEACEPIALPATERDASAELESTSPNPDDVKEPPANVEQESKSSRRKRQQQRSARARKDKLRSTTAPAEPAAPAKPPGAPVPTPQTVPTRSGWLVPADRAAAFEPPVPEPAFQPGPAAVVPAAVMPAAVPPHAVPAQPQPPFVPSQSPYAAPVGLPQPVFPQVPPQHTAVQAHPVPAPASAYGVPMMTRAATPAVTQPVARREQQTPTLKLKSDAQAGRPLRKQRRNAAAIEPAGVERMPPPHVERGSSFETAEPRPFPWKLAGVGIAIIAVLVIAGRLYLASSHKTADADASPAPAAAATASSKVSEKPKPPAKGMGQIVITTQPDGAKVLLDGKAAGETPLTLDAPPGKHLVTMIASTGTVKRTVRVALGKSQTLDVPIFSGWVALFAPILLDVSEDGRSMGTTEQSRILLSAGHHKLTLSNPDLGYSAVQEVDIDPGEVRSVTITPRGPANFNAVPWATVWMDGKQLGDTPLANLDVPLGVHEFVFKNPQFPDRKVSVTIRAGAPTAVSVDFTKPQQPN